ncbi:hypothetical protein PsorP6_014127 [Peronosclerospora sorghi]|uniref:Uncharacterized protein n=1 Tax=Peronosclerospora sorghi TaxID=230839 RepID=A0ACC0VIP7_9STRA|nr:hypothetical protein PsorP6_014127 [Peronosclerospora sorghi]
MVKLYCAVVGVKGRAFSVKIDASESVGDLKKAVKVENEDITCPARNLQLFLARTASGAWVTEADVIDGVTDTNGLKPLDVAGAPLNMVGLSERTCGTKSRRKLFWPKRHQFTYWSLFQKVAMYIAFKALWCNVSSGLDIATTTFTSATTSVENGSAEAGFSRGSSRAGQAVARAEPVKPWLEPFSKYFLL